MVQILHQLCSVQKGPERGVGGLHGIRPAIISETLWTTTAMLLLLMLPLDCYSMLQP